MNINSEIKVEFILSPGDLIPKTVASMVTAYFTRVNFHILADRAIRLVSAGINQLLNQASVSVEALQLNL